MNKNFNLGITDENFVGKQNLRHKIDKIRKAVNKKFARREKIYESLSLKFSVPARMVMRWSEGKLINLSNPNEVKRICQILREREFYLDFGDDFCEKQIPLNINEFLYDKIDDSEY